MHRVSPTGGPLLGGKTIAVLAVVAISGVTSAVGVLVTERSPAPAGTTPRVAAQAPPPRLRLASSDDVRKTELHRAHLSTSSRIDCNDCHELRAEEFLPPAVERCVACHENHEPAVHAASSDAAACLTCHDFLLPTGAGAWAGSCASCHAEPQGTRPAISAHTEQCTACHAVHASRAKPACESCHDNQPTGHAGGHDAAACLSCHPPHTTGKSALERCSGVMSTRPSTARDQITK